VMALILRTSSDVKEKMCWTRSKLARTVNIKSEGEEYIHKNIFRLLRYM